MGFQFFFCANTIMPRFLLAAAVLLLGAGGVTAFAPTPLPGLLQARSDLRATSSRPSTMLAGVPPAPVRAYHRAHGVWPAPFRRDGEVLRGFNLLRGDTRSGRQTRSAQLNGGASARGRRSVERAGAQGDVYVPPTVLRVAA